MRTVDFFGLPRSAQDHFLDATAGTQNPVPLAATLGGPKGHRVGWAIALFGLVLAGALFVRGFGDLDSAAAVHGLPLIGAWVLAFALLAGGVLHARAGDRAIASLPWKAGVYAFPSAVIDARTHLLRRFDVDTLEQIDATGGQLVLRFSQATFRFTADGSTIASARAAIEAMKASPPTSHERDSADPLASPRMTSPLAPQHQLVRTVPAWARGRFVLAAVFAAALGPSFWFSRNVISDDRAFAAAKAHDDIASYKAYLENGVRHRDEVQKTLLPRAELAVAKKLGTVDAILAYEKGHPQSAIQKEVDSSLHAALLAELAVAKKAGTLAALNDFEKLRPGHGLDTEVASARHEVYQAALAAFRTVANDKDPQVASFFERLLASAEKRNDPKVEIRFRQAPSTSLGRADKYVTKQAMFNGDTSYPSHYFEHDKLAKHEKDLGKAIESKLAAAFPAEILSFAVGAQLPEGDALPTVTVPTLFVVHRPEWSGTAYPNQRPRGIYVGMNHHFDAQLALPVDTKPLKVHAVIPASVPLKILKDFQKSIPKPGEPEATVYAAMAQEAFDTFATRFSAAIFKNNNSKK